MAATLTIGGTAYTMIEDQFDLTLTLDERQRFRCDFIDYTGTTHLQKGMQVTVSDPVLGTIFNGFIYTDKETPQYPSGAILHSIDCIDQRYIADKRTYSRTYTTPQPAGKLAVDQLHDVLLAEGINQNFAERYDTTASDFGTGTLTNIVGASTLGDGDLELAPSGTSVIYSESTTAQFASGTLTNCTATNNTLIPNGTNAIKMVAVMALAGNVSNTVTSAQVWAGSQAVSSSGQTWIEYDVFIDPSSPAATMGVDILFSDGSSFMTTGAVSGANEDGQFILPDASNDLSGLATTGWYHRKMSISTGVSNGKTISAILVVCKGTRVGTYVGYFKNVVLTGTTTATFFSSTLNVNPPQQLQNYGYSSTTVSVVETYDLFSATAPALPIVSTYRTSPAIAVGAVKLLKSSMISWTAITAASASSSSATTGIAVQYSLDGTYFYTCTNNAALPYLPAGTDLTGLSLTLRYLFYSSSGANVELFDTLESVTLTLNTSYAATKSDVAYIVDTQAGWNAGTLTNTVANSNAELTLNGYVRNWDDGSDANQAMYASGIQAQTVNNRSFTFWNIPSGSNVEVRSRMDFVGTWQNFTAEVDIQLNPADPVQHGITYRTTNWQNNSGSAAYYVWVTTVIVALGKGTNSSSSSPSAQTIITSASANYASSSWHRLRVVVNGNSHQVYVDGILILSATDSTYTAAGYIAPYTTDGGSGASSPYTVFFDNFGVASALSGTWLSPSQSLTAVGSYGNSMISWRDKSALYNGESNTAIKVEVTYNGGSTWNTCTNGAALPGLTLGQSLSGVNAQFRITLSTSTAGSLPAIDNFVVRILGQYSSSGTRTTAPLGIDTMSRANQSGWGTAFDGQSWTKTGTGTDAIASNEATITNTTGDVHEVLGSHTWTDEEGTVRFQLSASTMQAGMELRYSNANNYYRLAASTTALSIIKNTGGGNTTLATAAVSLTTGTWYRMRFRVTGSLPVALYGKVWPDGQIEPGVSNGVFSSTNPQWTVTASD